MTTLAKYSAPDFSPSSEDFLNGDTYLLDTSGGWDGVNSLCLLRAQKLGLQPTIGDTRGTRVEQDVSSLPKVLRGPSLRMGIRYFYYDVYSVTYVPQISISCDWTSGKKNDFLLILK